VTSVVEEARVYSVYAKKKTIDVDDVRLAVKIITDKSYSTVPPRDVSLVFIPLALFEFRTLIILHFQVFWTLSLVM
jgi:hypothetical protein